MKLHYDPKIYLIAGPQTRDANLHQFMADHDLEGIPPHEAGTPGEAIPEIAGRTCYMSFKNKRPGGNKAYIQHIKEVGHGSVLEHPSWSFIITGISRSLTHEFVRHRPGWAYSQLSQRYVDESRADFVVPHELRQEVAKAWPIWSKAKAEQHLVGYGSHDDPQIQAGMDWLSTLENQHHEYVNKVNYLLKRMQIRTNWIPDTIIDKNVVTTEMRKAARGTARSVLPNCTETKLFVTGNVRGWRHFIEQRGSKHADVEIRKVAYAVWDILYKEAPSLFSDYHWIVGETKIEGGSTYLTPEDVGTPYRKV